jgi:hypothetical protein
LKRREERKREELKAFHERNVNKIMVRVKLRNSGYFVGGTFPDYDKADQWSKIYLKAVKDCTELKIVQIVRHL